MNQSEPQINPCKTCNATGQYFGKLCPDCLGAGYTAIDQNYEYYLQPQDNGFVIYDIKNPPEYRGMLQKQKAAQNNSQTNSSQPSKSRNTSYQNNSNNGYNKFRNYNEADITPEEWKETREQFLKIALRFVLIISIIILLVLYFVFKQAGSEQSLKQILYLIIVAGIALIISIFSNSKLFKKLEEFVRSYWTEPNDYKKWLKDRIQS